MLNAPQRFAYAGIQAMSDKIILKGMTRVARACSSGAENPGSDTQVETRRRMIRQMKRVGDLCLLAGSPQDAKRHYQTAISTSTSKLGDHVHVGSMHEGLASAILLHIASQDISGNILERYDQCDSMMIQSTCIDRSK
jgi:hypothetical protein